MKYLIVDDEAVTRKSLKGFLEQKKHSCKTAGNAEAALSILEKEMFDFVITDFKMRGMNGIDLLKRIRQKFSDTITIIITGYADVENTANAVNYGAKGFFQKPLDIGKLNKLLNIAESEREKMRTNDASFKSSVYENIAFQNNWSYVKNSITKLPNWERFIERLTNKMERKERLAVIDIHLDNFDFLNNYLGFNTGNKLMQVTAERIKTCKRERDILCQIRNNSFAILLSRINSPDEAVIWAKQLLQVINRPISIQGKELYMKTVMGIGAYPHHGEEPEILLKNVNTALHYAKKKGKERVRLYSQPIPESCREPVEKALKGTQRLASSSFDMELRVGMVPIKIILKEGVRTRIAKLQVSPWGTLAMFSGGGLAFAEKLIKNLETSAIYAIQPGSDLDPNNDQELFEGLECRWKPIQSKKGETLTLMVVANSHNLQDNNKTYSRFIKEIQNIYGSTEDYCPVRQSQMEVTLNSKLLAPEVKVRTFGKDFLTRLAYPIFLKLSCVLGRIIFKYGLRVGEMDGKEYLNNLTKNSDFQKFDDTLRMIIDSSPDQRKRLVDYLEREKNAGILFYGIQISDSALMTCLVFDRKERHLHFVDGASGGYALAAKQLKIQLSGENTKT